MKRRWKFTLYHGFAASLILHSALAMPFVIHAWAAAPDDDDPTLVIDLNGVITDTQTEQKLVQETKGEVTPQPTPPAPAAQAVAAAEQPQPEAEIPTPAPSPQTPSPPRPDTKSADAGANNVRGANQQQDAQTILQADPARLDAYMKALTKKVESNLVYPDEGRRASAKVSFVVRSDGQIRPDSLKIIESGGQAVLDASALKTIRACLPFAPPPTEMTLAITVDFGPKH
jgi:periplasmic protein TonB